MTQKTLEAYNDVFADIVNVLLFDGKQVITENDLENGTTHSIYKADGKLHEQERDVAKFWKNANIHIAFIGLENQTSVDKDMPLRILGYDGAAYRSQMIPKYKEVKNEGKIEKVQESVPRYPVVSMVLYMGYERRWNKPKTLYECLQIPEALRPYVSDYKTNVFEIAYLSDEKVKQFQSDFRYVADFLVQMRKNKDYVASTDTLNHVQEVFHLMGVLTDDERFINAANESLEKGGPKRMCEVLNRAEERGFQKGEASKKKELAKNFWKNSEKSFIQKRMSLTEFGYSNDEIEQVIKECEHERKEKAMNKVASKDLKLE